MDDTDDSSEVDQSDDWGFVDADPLLISLVQLMNTNAGTSVSLTVTTPGSVVTGTLTGIRDWFAAAEQSARASAGDVAGMLFATLAPEEDEDVTGTPTYLHLAEARYISGSKLMPGGDGIFWRGRLDQVSGWNLAHIAP
jgi:hypothetical protein